MHIYLDLNWREWVAIEKFK